MIISHSLRDAWSGGGAAGRLAVGQTVYQLATVSRTWSTEALVCFVELQFQHIHENKVLRDSDPEPRYNVESRHADSEALSSLYRFMQAGVFSPYFDLRRHCAIYDRYAAMAEALLGPQTPPEKHPLKPFAG